MGSHGHLVISTNICRVLVRVIRCFGELTRVLQPRRPPATAMILAEKPDSDTRLVLKAQRQCSRCQSRLYFALRHTIVVKSSL